MFRGYRSSKGDPIITWAHDKIKSIGSYSASPPSSVPRRLRSWLLLAGVVTWDGLFDCQVP